MASPKDAPRTVAVGPVTLQEPLPTKTDQVRANIFSGPAGALPKKK